jgi:CBS domain-containing protein
MEASPTSTPAAPPLFAAEPQEPPVADFMSTTLVKVPAWFTAGAALRVGRLKRAAHLIVLDRQQVVGSVAVELLARLPAHEPVARAMIATRLAVGPDTSRRAALTLMDLQRLDCLPVVSGALLVGVVTRTALA